MKVGASTATCPRAGIEKLQEFIAIFDKAIWDYEALLTRTASGNSAPSAWGDQPGRAIDWGLTGPPLRDPASSGTSGAPSPTRSTRTGVRHPHRKERRHLRPVPRPDGGDAAVQPHPQAVHSEIGARRRGGQGGADPQAQACRDLFQRGGPKGELGSTSFPTAPTSRTA